MTSTQRAQALKLLGARSMMRLKDFAAHRIGPETLARLVRDGIVVRPARGLYQLADGAADARRTLAEAAALVPKGIICLVSALQFHGLTLQMPSSVWMAIERTAWRPRKATSDQLWCYATKARIWSTMKPYVEATAADGT